MKHLMDMVNNVIAAECSIAALEHGSVNNSDHESYAIILEECEEASEEVNLIAECLEHFWNKVRVDAEDNYKLNDLKCLEHHAMLAACEFVQVAAMARKAMFTIHEKGASE